MKHPTPITRSTLGLSAGAFLACLSAQADVVTLNEFNSTHIWTLPAGTNLLAGATGYVPATANTNEGSSASWATLTDGSLGPVGDKTTTVTPNNGTSVNFTLDTSVNTLGYDITQLDSYCAWPDSGRDNQNYTVYYATVSAPTTFIPIATVNNATANPDNSTHTRLTDTASIVAHNVAVIRYVFASQENGYTGFRELIALGNAATETWVNPLVTLNESNTDNTWTLPSGTNLLAAATPTPAVPPVTDHGNGDITSGSYATWSDGLVGLPAEKTASVAPNNNTTVTFALNISTNFNGYNISSLDSYCAWPDSGRDNQNYTVKYSTVAAPTVFTTIALVSNQTSNPQLATHTRLSSINGILASNVHSIQFTFANQENGWTGFREFVVLGTAVSLSPPLTWTGGSGANWVSTADSNWKQTSGGAPANFSPLSALTFDTTGTNTTITVDGAGVTASSLAFTNNNTKPYSFGGGTITSPNELTASGSGSVTFNNSTAIGSGLTFSGSGSLTLNAPTNSAGLIVSGTGTVTLGTANTLGATSVSNGVLNLANDASLGASGLSLTGGTVNILSSAPVLSGLSGTGGTVVLGNTTGPVNTTLTIGGANGSGVFTGNITNASGAVGSLTKVGTGIRAITGTNTYTGATVISGGYLEFGKRASFYNGNIAAGAANLQVASGAVASFQVGGSSDFTSSDFTLLNSASFTVGSSIGFNTGGNFTLADALTYPVGVVKTGVSTLRFTASNTYPGSTLIRQGTLEAANASGPSILGDVYLGDATANMFLNMGASNQFSPSSVLHFTNGVAAENAKFNLRGTTQTIGGLDATVAGSRLGIIQNDETTAPGYTTNPGPATLIINTASDHSFHGLIRNADGGALSIIKEGAGTQELVNAVVQANGYTGATTINAGTFRLNFSGGTSGFASDITVNAPGTFSLDGTFTFGRLISGAGSVVKQGTGTVNLNNGGNLYSGGTSVNAGTLVLTGGGVGEGTGPGDHCNVGLMDPSNVVTVNSLGTLAFNATAPLGNSNLLPQFSPSVVVSGGTINALGTSITFVPNLTLNGGTINVGDGNAIATFNTSLGLLGTVVVGGSTPSLINTTGSGANANVSLGANSLAGTTFQVADATGDAASDLIISSILRDILATPSALTKTGPGTLLLSGANTYTGGTVINGGTVVAASPTALGSGALNLANGTLNINGLATVASATFGASGNLALELPNTGTRGVDYDALTVTGALVLDGTITVSFNGLSPEMGFSFDLIDAASTDASAFNVASDLILPALPAGMGWDVSGFVANGVITIVDAPTGYASQFGLSGPNAAPGADPDGDGISNALEYAFGTNPTAGNGAEYRGIASTVSGVLTLAYRRPVNGVSGVTYGVEFKTADLDVGSTGWTAGVLNTHYTQVITPIGDGTETVTITLTGAVSGKKFARVTATY